MRKVISVPEINIRKGFVDKIVIAFFLTSAIFIPVNPKRILPEEKRPPHAGI
jgi:hypothetical protein